MLGTAFVTSVLVLRAGGGDPVELERLTWLGATSLVMCAVGVANAMLMSVAERFREIGTIKCLGASDGFIVQVFLLEAALLGGSGSLVGSLLGTLAAMVSKPGIPAAGIIGGMLIGFALGAALTVVAAVAPAIQAAKMPAAAALRVEV